MQIDKNKLERVASEAKAKSAGQPRWIAAINKAVDGLLGGWIVTEVMDGLFITTESGETYHANGKCQCKAYQLNQPCKHRAAAQLVKRYNEVADVATSLETVDYTQKPVSEKVILCPKCGRNGLAERRQFGDMPARLLVGVVHIGQVNPETLEVNFIDACEVTPERWQQEIADVCAAELATASARADAITFDQMASAPIVKPQPKGTYLNGWNI